MSVMEVSTLELDVVEALRYFHSPDGPNMSINTLSIYCGVTPSAMRDYISGRYKPIGEKRR